MNALGSADASDRMLAGSSPNRWLAFAAALAVFIGVSIGTRLLVQALKPSAPWVPQATIKGMMVFGCMALAYKSRLGLDTLGFRAPVGAPWGRGIAGGLALGALATLLVLFVSSLQHSSVQHGTGPVGLQSIMKGYSFGQIVLWIWVVSSVAEEIFCRGWFQGWTLGSEQSAAGVSTLLPSALLFGSMHLMLLTLGIDLKQVAILVTLLTVLGLLAAWMRATSGSIYPAIAAHVAFNVGGVIGGIVYAVSTGHLPTQPM